MIIFPDNKAVWIHTPKTAGSAFEEMCWARHNLPVIGMQHDTARDIPSHLDNAWVFGFIRDPIMVEVSDWRYHKYSWETNENFTFENWCRWRFEDERLGQFFGIQNPDDIRHGRNWNIRPQAGYFCDEKGDCIADAIFRYEELEESLKIASDITGLNLSLPPSEQGVTTMTYPWSQGREDYSQYVTDEAERILRKAKGIDFMIHSWPGPVLRKFKCPTVQDYAYTR